MELEAAARRGIGEELFSRYDENSIPESVETIGKYLYSEKCQKELFNTSRSVFNTRLKFPVTKEAWEDHNLREEKTWQPFFARERLWCSDVAIDYSPGSLGAPFEWFLIFSLDWSLDGQAKAKRLVKEAPKVIPVVSPEEGKAETTALAVQAPAPLEVNISFWNKIKSWLVS